MWWEALSVLQKVYFCIAVSASVLLVLQIVLLLFGIGGGDADVDADIDGDTSFEGDSGFALFSIKGLIACFAIGGWVGYTLADTNTVVAIVLSIVAGLAALVFMGFVMRAIIKMQSTGNIDLSKAVGKIVDVYLTIPPLGEGEGKISLIVDERFVVQSAASNSNESFKTGTKVKITDVSNNVYIVEAASKEKTKADTI